MQIGADEVVTTLSIRPGTPVGGESVGSPPAGSPTRL
jgi:hypothetical protein